MKVHRLSRLIKINTANKIFKLKLKNRCILNELGSLKEFKKNTVLKEIKKEEENNKDTKYLIVALCGVIFIIFLPLWCAIPGY